MNSIIFFPDDQKSDNLVEITGKRAQEIFATYNLTSGAKRRVAQWGGARGWGEVLSLANSSIKLRIELTEPQLPKLPITVIVGITRPQTIKKIIHLTTSIGVGRLVFVNCEFSQKSYFKSKALLPENLNFEQLKALEQSTDSQPIKILIYKGFKTFCEDFLANEFRSADIGIVAAPETCASIQLPADTASAQHTFVAIGPEGGWSEYELGRFKDYGFTSYHLGPRILRTEVAAAVLLGQVITK